MPNNNIESILIVLTFYHNKFLLEFHLNIFILLASIASKKKFFFFSLHCFILNESNVIYLLLSLTLLFMANSVENFSFINNNTEVGNQPFLLLLCYSNHFFQFFFFLIFQFLWKLITNSCIGPIASSNMMNGSCNVREVMDDLNFRLKINAHETKYWCRKNLIESSNNSLIMNWIFRNLEK